MTNISRRSFAAGLTLSVMAFSAPAGATRGTAATKLPKMTVYKTPTCGCCNAWISHVIEAGFEVQAVEVLNTTLIAVEYGVPSRLRSCHTAIIGEYAVEGHVPAGEIKRLLAERPSVAGLAVAGMPIGSPGMEVGDRRDPYQVIAFNRNGQGSVFATY